tara:strand:+ start:1666 stop:2325 length:660 start_codon:yes stop_codon:yes gene_type:complete
MNRHLIVFASLILGLHAQTPAAELPEPVGSEDFEALSELSPFTRPLNLSETLALTGFARIGEQSLITLRDHESKQSHLVSADSNDQGWKLVDVSGEDGPRPEAMLAEISVPGGEVVEIRFDENQIDPEHMRERAGGKNSGPLRDNRLPPSKEDREKWGHYVKERMSKMSEGQRKQVGQIMKDKMHSSGSQMSDRQKGEMFVRILDHVEKQGGQQSGKTK